MSKDNLSHMKGDIKKMVDVALAIAREQKNSVGDELYHLKKEGTTTYQDLVCCLAGAGCIHWLPDLLAGKDSAIGYAEEFLVVIVNSNCKKFKLAEAVKDLNLVITEFFMPNKKDVAEIDTDGKLKEANAFIAARVGGDRIADKIKELHKQISKIDQCGIVPTNPELAKKMAEWYTAKRRT